VGPKNLFLFCEKCHNNNQTIGVVTCGGVKIVSKNVIS